CLAAIAVSLCSAVCDVSRLTTRPFFSALRPPPPPRSPLFPYTTLFRSSLMPPGLTASLDKKEFLDLVSFLSKLGENLRGQETPLDRKSTRLNSSHVKISYAVFCLKKKKNTNKYCIHRQIFITNGTSGSS